MVRVSRPCYDKIWRCPGWIGGGVKYPRGESRCDNGRIALDFEAPLWKWRMWRCNTCDVIIWPYMIRYLSVPWLAYEIRCVVREIRYRWRSR